MSLPNFNRNSFAQVAEDHLAAFEQVSESRKAAARQRAMASKRFMGSVAAWEEQTLRHGILSYPQYGDTVASCVAKVFEMGERSISPTHSYHWNNDFVAHVLVVPTTYEMPVQLSVAALRRRNHTDGLKGYSVNAGMRYAGMPELCVDYTAICGPATLVGELEYGNGFAPEKSKDLAAIQSIIEELRWASDSQRGVSLDCLPRTHESAELTAG